MEKAKVGADRPEVTAARAALVDALAWVQEVARDQEHLVCVNASSDGDAELPLRVAHRVQHAAELVRNAATMYADVLRDDQDTGGGW